MSENVDKSEDDKAIKITDQKEEKDDDNWVLVDVKDDDQTIDFKTIN